MRDGMSGSETEMKVRRYREGMRVDEEERRRKVWGGWGMGQ